MAKIDRLKEEIAYIRYYISVAITVAIALAGWLVLNMKTAGTFTIISGSIIVVSSVIYIYSRHKRVYQLLQEIEDA